MGKKSSSKSSPSSDPAVGPDVESEEKSTLLSTAADAQNVPISKKAAWVDDDDAKPEEEAMPSFYTKQHAKPSWAISDKEAAQRQTGEEDAEAGDGIYRPNVSRKRFRHEDLDQLLSQTAPLLAVKSVGSSRIAPKILSTAPLPRDTARTVQWHPSGQLMIVGGNHHVYLFHASGKYVEQLSKIDIMSGGVSHGKGAQKITSLKGITLTSGGDEVLLTGTEAYLPVRLSLHTEQKTPLRFLDTRDTEVYRHSKDEVPKSQRFITKIVSQSSSGTSSSVSSSLIGVASGSMVRLGSLSSGCITSTIMTDSPVTDLHFLGDRQLYVSSGKRVLLYDVRMGSRFVQEFVDDGALHVTSFAVSSKYLAVGSSSGVVTLYDRMNITSSSSSSSSAPLKTFSQLTTAIDGVNFGVGSDQHEHLSFFTKGQKAAFRLAHLPDAQVVPSFPAVSTRHEFIQSIEFASTVPVLSVGEKQRVVNYAV